MALIVPNFARTTLRAAITYASTQLQLAIGSGVYFDIGAGNYMYLTIEDGNAVEIVRYTCTGPVVNDTITVTRGVDGTQPRGFPAGSCVKASWNVAQITEMIEQTVVNLFAAAELPPNTIEVLFPPTEQPPLNVLYAVWVEEKRFWYWDGAVWTELGNMRDAVLSGYGPPSGEPASGVAFYVDLNGGTLWYWMGDSWITISDGSSGSEEYWVRYTLAAVGTGPLVSLPVNGQIALGAIPGFTDRWRQPPSNGSPSILSSIPQAGIPPGVPQPKVTLAKDAVVEITINVRGQFFPEVPPTAIIALSISNSSDGSLFGSNAVVDPTNDPDTYVPDVLLSASTGVLSWPKDTYFDGNVTYVPTGAGPWPDFHIIQATASFHVIKTI